jgi:plasmid segregation protein ParM
MEAEMEILGIDIGFGFTKVTNGKEFTLFKSVLGEATDIQFRMNLENSTSSKNLHVTIDKKSYFVGDFAEQQSSVRYFTLEKEKLISEFVKVLSLTSIGIYSKKPTPINIVTGLPVEYLRQYRKRFIQILKGHHDITYHKFDGTEVSRKIDVREVFVLPQPIGSVFNLLMDDMGKITNMELKKQKIGVVDIGFRTTDFAILDKLQYLERGSNTLDIGISNSFKVITNKLQQQAGVNVELYRMYDAIDMGSIIIRGKEYDISNLRDQMYAQSAGTIAKNINRLWAEDWDIDTIILSGGGGKELAKYIQPLIEGNVIPIDINTDARLNNVQGYLKFGLYKWGQSASETPAQTEERDA